MKGISSEAALERSQRWLKRTLLLRIGIGVFMALLVISIFLSPSGREYGAENKGSVQYELAVAWLLASTMLTGFWLHEKLFRWIERPIRRSRSSLLIELSGEWEGNAQKAVASELVARAAGKDRMARNYLLGEPYTEFPDGDGSTARRASLSFFPNRIDRRERIVLLDSFGKFRTLRAGSVRAYKVRRLFGLLMVVFHDPVKETVKPLRGDNVFSLYGMVGLALYIGGAMLILSTPSFDPDDFKRIPTRQLIFTFIHRTAGLRRGAAVTLLSWAKDDVEAKAACFRLGLLLRDSRLEAGYRQASTD